MFFESLIQKQLFEAAKQSIQSNARGHVNDTTQELVAWLLSEIDPQHLGSLYYPQVKSLCEYAFLASNYYYSGSVVNQVTISYEKWEDANEMLKEAIIGCNIESFFHKEASDNTYVLQINGEELDNILGINHYGKCTIECICLKDWDGSITDVKICDMAQIIA